MIIVFENIEDQISQWCLEEYKFASSIIGSEHLLITNCEREAFEIKDLKTDHRKALEFLPFERSVLLDSEATEVLVPNDVENFDYFIIGGILGNVDEFDADKTSVLRTTGIKTRNLGHFQMTMDTAAICCKLILKDSIFLHEIPFIDRPTIALSDKEHVQMDFRYIRSSDGGQPLMSKEILKLLRSEEALDMDLLE